MISDTFANHRWHGRFHPTGLLAPLLLIVCLLPGVAPAQGGLDELLSDGKPAEPAADAPRIEVDADGADDEAIERRLSGIFGELEALSEVTVQVSSGVITLGGEVGSAASAERSVALARSVNGVVDVIDAQRVEADVGQRLRTTFSRMRTSFLSLVASLPVFLLALLVLGLFWWASGWLTRGRSLFARLTPNDFIAELLAGVVRLLIVLAGIVLALSLLDATSLIGTVLGAAGIVGLAVGFAVRDTVENYIASILLSLRTPFLSRDMVQIGEHSGHVARLTGRATILISIDGNHVRIPNATVFKSTIVNYSRNPERRFEFTVGVDTDLDPGQAQQLAQTTLKEVSGVLADPPPSVLISELGDSNVTLTVMGWIDQRETDLLKARSAAIRRVKQAFDAAGIVMPEPIYRLRIDARGAALPLADPASGSTAGADAGTGEEGSGTLTGALTQGSPEEPSVPETPTEQARADAAPLPACAEADTSADTSTRATLERELEKSGEPNLLDGATRHE